MFIRRELGGTGTGCLFQFTYCAFIRNSDLKKYIHIVAALSVINLKFKFFLLINQRLGRHILSKGGRVSGSPTRHKITRGYSFPCADLEGVQGVRIPSPPPHEKSRKYRGS